MSSRILVVDDEPSIVEVLSLYLTREGFEVLTAVDGDAAYAAATNEHPDLIVLDIMLPYRSGLELMTSLRKSQSIPVILLTARTDEMDRIAGLELGADDYVVKPFSPREVVARVKAVLRRAGAQPADETRNAAIQAGSLKIDPAERSVSIDGRDVRLTAKEFDLLYFLASSPRQVFTRAQLLDHVWGTDIIADESTVTVHIRRLREKVEADPSDPQLIQTVWGVGYRFDVNDRA